MKTRFVVALAVVCSSLGVVTGGLVAHAGPGATPEIDRANAKVISLQGPPLRQVSCPGEDAMGYTSYYGAFTGGITQIVPDPTDYPLPAGSTLSLTGIVWTINLKTMRGVLTATVGIGTAAAPIYSGKLTLVTQGLPTATGAPVPGRGWINAKATPPDEGATTPGDDSLIANVEAKLTSVGVGTLQFGNGVPSLAIPDYSVVTNVAPAPAADGTC